MDYEKAAAHWIERDKLSVHMDAANLKIRIEEFLKKHNTCALAVADGDFVRCTPIEYMYQDGAIYMFSEGGLKFRALKNNKHVCIAIYDNYSGFGTLGGMQVTGMAELVEPWSEAYIAIIQAKGIPVEAFKKLPEPMNLIKVTPQVIDYLDSSLKKEGFGTRQQLNLQKKKALIAYFSRADENYFGGNLRSILVGNTAIAAMKLQEITGADVFEIKMEVPYSANYKECVQQAVKDKAENARPRLAKLLSSIDEYDTIYLGYPNYCGTIPMPVATFLEAYDFTGKTILPFCTNEGSGMGTSEEDIRNMIPTAKLGKGLPISGSHVESCDAALKQWI